MSAPNPSEYASQGSCLSSLGGGTSFLGAAKSALRTFRLRRLEPAAHPLSMDDRAAPSTCGSISSRSPFFIETTTGRHGTSESAGVGWAIGSEAEGVARARVRTAEGIHPRLAASQGALFDRYGGGRISARRALDKAWRQFSTTTRWRRSQPGRVCIWRQRSTSSRSETRGFGWWR